MRLTSFSDYSLRVLIYLALQEQGTRCTIADIAEAYAISKNHLMKVVHYLAGAGYVATVRGKGGGICLAMSPEAVCIGAVVRATDSETGLVECFQDDSECRIEGACALKGVFTRAREAFYGELDRYSLADVARPSHRLRQMLAVG